MMLLIDLGNTHIKWQYWCQDECVDQQSCLANDVAYYQEHWIGYPIKEAWIASVGASACLAQAENTLTQMGCRIHKIVTEARQHGVINGYAKAQTLGVDRWLGLIAAHHNLPGIACLVVDAGTAVTLDLIDGSGHHRGGLILPGIRTMQKALIGDTAQLGAAIKYTDGLGCSTETCIGNGSLHALTSIVEVTYKRAQIRYPELRCLLTGGDGKFVYDHLSIPAQYEANWIFKGIKVYLEQNRYKSSLFSG